MKAIAQGVFKLLDCHSCGCGYGLTPKLSDAAPVAHRLAAESAEQAACVTLGWRSLERLVRLFGEFHGDVCNGA